MIALVFGVMAASTWSGSMHHVSGVTSTMTGSAPAAIGAYAVAANVSAGMMTSSPQPMPSAFSATSIVIVPFDIRMPCFAPWYAANAVFESAAVPAGLGESAPIAAADHVGDRFDLAIVAARPRRIRGRADRCAAVDRQFLHRFAPPLMSDVSLVCMMTRRGVGSARACLDSGEGRSVASPGIVRKVSFALGGGAATTVDRTSVGGTPSLLRAINERTVLESVRRVGPVSRAQIARETALSKPTVSQALVTLLDAGLVREAGRTSGGKGPTAVLYELNPQAGWVVGIDVGRDWVRAAIADVTGQFVARRDERARVKSAKTLITQIGAIAHALAADAGIKWRQVTFATVGSPGVFEQERGQVALAYALPGWGRQGLVELVQQELGTKIAFENDVNLAAIGEQWQGLGKGVENFVYLHLGTGVGMGMVLNGELYRGSSGAAGEVGYLPLAETDMRDPSNRRRGALDVAASATGVVAEARRLGMPPPLTAKKVFEEARRGDRKARRVVAGEAHRIALAIVAVASVVDPELVILGGGIGSNGDLLLEPVGQELRDAVAVPASRRGLHAATGSDAVRLGVDGVAGGSGPVVRTRRGVRVIPDGARDRRPVKERGDQGQWFRSRRRETNMKRWLIAMATFALVAAACTAGGGDDTPSAVDTASGASHAPVTLEMWGAWTGRELKQFNTIFDGFTEKYPWITVNSTGGVERSEDPGCHQCGRPAGHGAVVHARQRGEVLRVGRVAGPQPVHRAERLRREPVPAVGRGVHELRGEPLRVPVPDGRSGPVLQHRHVRGRRGSTGRRKTLSELAGRREEADRVQLRTARSRSRGSCRGSATTSSAPRTSGTCSARSGTTRTGPRRRSTRIRAWKAMFQWQHDFIADVYGDGDFQTGADKLAAVRRRGGR